MSLGREEASMSRALNRRTFLKQTGLGTVALAGVPAIAAMSATPVLAEDDEGTSFFFSARDSAGGPADSLVMQGCGHFGDGRISGFGFFFHFDASAAGVPKPIKATGLWKPRKLISFNSIGTYGTNVAGIMVADVLLERQSPKPEATIPARLRLVCNNGAAGLFTGEDEGFQLVVGALTFTQLTPTVGISGFSRSLED
jgi:hypothetical protein